MEKQGEREAGESFGRFRAHAVLIEVIKVGRGLLSGDHHQFSSGTFPLETLVPRHVLGWENDDR